MRARVLQVAGEQVTLGVYLQGCWLRLEARTRVALALGDWIEGTLVYAENGELVHFRIDEAAPIERSNPTASSGLDLEA